MTFLYSDHLPSHNELVSLYRSVGWENYVTNNEDMSSLFRQSDFYLTVWQDSQLIAGCRVISDHCSIAYVQDLLVHPRFQGQGIGTELLSRIYRQFNHLRQIVLITDSHEQTMKFYQKNGLQKLDEYGCTGFMKLNP